MTLLAEFTVEPFEAGRPGPHVRAALEAAGGAGLELDVGPLGTAMTGPDGQVLATVDKVLRAAMAEGATRVTLQVSVPGG
ncbi:MAG: thiamine-binding protein [Acidimicrobiales bacterium]